MISSHALITEQEIKRYKKKRRESAFPPKIHKSINFSLHPISSSTKLTKVNSITINLYQSLDKPSFPSTGMSIIPCSMGRRNFI